LWFLLPQVAAKHLTQLSCQLSYYEDVFRKICQPTVAFNGEKFIRRKSPLFSGFIRRRVAQKGKNKFFPSFTNRLRVVSVSGPNRKICCLNWQAAYQ